MLGWILKVFHERGGVPLVGDVSHRHAVLCVLAFGVGALVAGHATEVGEERAALRGELEVDRASLRCGALREHGGEVGGLLVGIGSGEDLRHQRVRTDGVRVADPIDEEVLLEFRAELGEQRGDLAMFRHAGSLGGQERGVIVAGGAVHLREEKSSVATLCGDVEFLVGRVRQERGRDGLEREIF